MSNIKYFFKNHKSLPIDIFLNNVLYDKNYGYYTKNFPFGKKGDFITSPLVSVLFSEILAIWIVSFWQKLNSPKKFNIVELGPGNGEMSKTMINVFKKFPKFNSSTSLYLYEKSEKLKKIQKKNISNSKVVWLKKFSEIKKGPILFIGNEFFDSIPIKQFIKEKQVIYQRYIKLNKDNKIEKINKKISKVDERELNKFKTLKSKKFIEYPKLGLNICKNIIKEISKRNGGLLLIDYGYYKKQFNYNTLQSIKFHKKNKIFKNLGTADITYLVNFKLLEEYFTLKKLKVKKVVSQSFFLKKMGIIERANMIANKMSFKEKSNLYSRIKRLLDDDKMGDLFKVIFAYKSKKNNFLGFD